MDTYVYPYHNSLYINLTNRCTNRCDFCIRNTSDGVGGHSLWLQKEPSVQDVMERLGEYDPGKYGEVVFCGYGEPTLRLDALLGIAGLIKQSTPSRRIRIDTNGQANMICGADVTPRFSGLIDALSVSLNAPDAESYDAACHSSFGPQAHAGIIDFAKKAKEHVPEVVFSVLDIIGEDAIKSCRDIAGSVGVGLKVRKRL